MYAAIAFAYAGLYAVPTSNVVITETKVAFAWAFLTSNVAEFCFSIAVVEYEPFILYDTEVTLLGSVTSSLLRTIVNTSPNTFS